MNRKPAKRLAFSILITVLAGMAAAEAPRQQRGAPPGGVLATASPQAVSGLSIEPTARLDPPFPAPAIAVVDGLAAGAPFGRAIGGVGEESAFPIRETADSGFVFSGTSASLVSGKYKTWIFKLDAAGNKVLEKYMTSGADNNDFGSVTALSDGGYLFNVQSYDPSSQPVGFHIGKMDANFTILSQTMVQSAGGLPYTASRTSDGGFLAVGNTAVITQTGFVITFDLIRLDSAGAIIWQKQLQAGSSLSGSVHVLADGKIMLIGTRSAGFDPTTNDGLIILLDSNANVLWGKTIGGPDDDRFYSAMPANDGGYLVSGVTKSFGSGVGSTFDTWLLKLDTNGNIVLQKTFGGAGEESASIYSASSTSYVVSGQTRSTGGAGDGYLVKLNNSLGVTLAKTYDASGEESLFAAPDSAGGFLLQGSTDANGRKKDILIAKTDSNGVVQWARAYGGAEDEFVGFAFRLGTLTTSSAVSAAALADAELLLSGSTPSFGAGGNDALAARLDSLGQLPGCPLVQTVTLTAATWAIPTADSTATVTALAPITTPASYTTSPGILTVANSTSTVTNVCTATPALSATAAADKTSGTAPLTVAFTGSATNGTPPYTWEWDFGDGTAKSTQQNPSHTYTDPGSFPVTLKVTDSAAKTATDTHLTIDVSGTCTLFCSSNVPATGTAGQLVTFQGSVESVSCSGSPAYSWTFGDSQTSSTQSPSHTYAAAGTFNWTLTVTQNGQSCSNNGSITIGGGVAQSVWWVPSIAHAPGAGGSKWRSNIAAVNRSGSTATLSLVFVPYSSGANVTKPYSLANGATVEWADVLVSLFAFADSANTKGTVKISSDKPIYAISRTYNQAASGTFGQYYPALIAAQGISGSQAAVLPLLKKNTAFRTNAGFQNLGSSSCTGEVKLFNATGVQVGSTRTLTAAADKYIQDDDVFTKAGAGTQDVAYARVQATTAGCKAWFFASVVDAVTNDPTTVPQQLSAAGPFWIPSIAHAPGAGSSKWRSNIAVVNRSGSTANLTLVFTPYAAGSTVTKTYTLANNNTVEWADVLVSLFAFADSANTKGTVKITSNVALFAISRTYNQAASGTFGQYYPALVASASITNGQSAVLPLLKKNTGFRTNAGFENLGDASCTGTVKLFNAAGVQVGTTRTLTAATDKYIQDDDVFTKAAAGNQEPAYALVEVTTVGGKAWFFASLVDAVTNDPTTIPQQ
jgi:PKD repeat protein